MTHAALLVTLAHLVGSPAAPPTVLGEIEARYRRGAIDLETRHVYRVAAFRRPERLPSDLRELPLGEVGGRLPSGTRVMVEAYQHVTRAGSWGSELHELLQPPTGDLDYVLNSSHWPIRVTYQSAYHESLARQVLSAADTSYSEQINSYGFYQPISRDASGLYRIYVDTTGMGGGGYTSPYDENQATAWDDCFTYIVIDPSNDEWSVDGVVAHEVNHAMQAAMDCLEVVTFWENTATYIMSQVFQDAWWYTTGFMSYFQSQPWRALDYMLYPYSDSSEYGGALFVYYLAQTYAPTGSQAPPKAAFVRRIWEASMQSNHFNEPDYYDSIAQVLGDDGFGLSMEEVLVDFSEARYFVGGDDDGAHIPGASQLWDAELTLTAMHTSGDLPVRGAGPPESRKPAPYGSNHVLVSFPSSYGHPLNVRFHGDADTRWSVRVVRFGGRPTVSEELPIDEETWDGSALVDTEGFNRLLLVVVNRGDENYDPDRRSWPVSGYTYDIAPVLPPAVIDELTPSQVIRGTQNVAMRLTGSGFASGPDFLVRFEDPDLQVVSLDGVGDTEVLFTLTAPLRTELGPKNLIVINGDGTQTRAVGILTVVEPIEPPDDNPKDGCGCASGRGGAPGLWLLLVLATLLWRRRRSA